MLFLRPFICPYIFDYLSLIESFIFFNSMISGLVAELAVDSSDFSSFIFLSCANILEFSD